MPRSGPIRENREVHVDEPEVPACRRSRAREQVEVCRFEITVDDACRVQKADVRGEPAAQDQPPSARLLVVPSPELLDEVGQVLAAVDEVEHLKVGIPAGARYEDVEGSHAEAPERFEIRPSRDFLLELLELFEPCDRRRRGLVLLKENARPRRGPGLIRDGHRPAIEKGDDLVSLDGVTRVENACHSDLLPTSAIPRSSRDRSGPSSPARTNLA